MTAPHPGPACPVDLHYADPLPPNLNLAAIIGHGRRIRRRRRLAQAGVLLAACVAAGSVVAGVRGFTISMFPSQPGPPASVSSAPIDAQVAENPPANGELTLISSSPRHWTTVAWATRRGDVCWATFRTPVQGATGEVQCPAWPRAEVPGNGGTAFSSLYPVVAPMGFEAPGRGNAYPFLGLTSPRAVRVVLTALGKDVSADVVPVPIGAGRTVGIFLAWIQAPGNGLNRTDISSETAYDPGGHIIARDSSPP